jgi:hypothetical protein
MKNPRGDPTALCPVKFDSYCTCMWASNVQYKALSIQHSPLCITEYELHTHTPIALRYAIKRQQGIFQIRRGIWDPGRGHGYILLRRGGRLTREEQR